MVPPSHVFICYAHENADAISADIDWLRGQGYDVWFDRNLHAGREWADDVAAAIDACFALFFIASQSSIRSTHCRNEIAYAIDAEKPVLTVFYEPLDLHGGLKLATSRTQALVRWQLQEEEYRRQLRNALEGYVRASRPALRSERAAVWYVPLNRNVAFTGRADALQAIHERLTSSRRHTALALTGPAGVGKTQLALEYLYRHASSVDVVAWIRAEGSATLDADFVHLAVELGLVREDEIDARRALDAVRRWLATHQDWLLVLDNLESPEVLRRYLAGGSLGRLLITSRRQVWGRLATTLLIEPLNPDEAVAFLLDRTSSADRAAAETLARTLGYLPLALEEAAAYIEVTGKPLVGYLELFAAHHDALMATSVPPEDYPRTLRTTLEVSLRQLEKEDPSAADLLRLIAFLAADDIPLWLLSKVQLSEVSDLPAEIVLDHRVACLRRYSLVKTDGDAVSTHRLTQLVTRSLMDEESRQTRAENALTLVSQQFPRVSEMGKAEAQCRRLLSHALAAVSHTRNQPTAAVAIGKLLGRTGTYLSARNLSHDASDHLAEAHRIFRDDPEQARLHARTCELYGRVLFANGSLDHSRQTFQEALPIFEAEGPSGLLHRMQIHLDLAWVFWTKGAFEGARDEAERSLRLLESVAGTADPHRATSLAMMGRLEFELNEVAKARDTIAEVVAAVPKIPNPDRQRTPLLCAVFLQMAQVLRYLGTPLRARSWAEESLQLGRPVYSEYHTLIGATHCVMGQVLMDLEELDDAKRELMATAECVERSRYPVNQDAFIGICYLALLLIEDGETDAAERLMTTRLVDVDKQVAGESALTKAYADLVRGALARQSNRMEEAIRCFEAGDQRIADRYGERHPHRLHPLSLLAACLLERERWGEAAHAHEVAFGIADAAGFRVHPQRGRHLVGSARLAERRGHAEEARAMYEEARQVFHDCLGPSSKPVVQLTEWLETKRVSTVR